MRLGSAVKNLGKIAEQSAKDLRCMWETLWKTTKCIVKILRKTQDTFPAWNESIIAYLVEFTGKIMLGGLARRIGE